MDVLHINSCYPIAQSSQKMATGTAIQQFFNRYLKQLGAKYRISYSSCRKPLTKSKHLYTGFP